jgi:hypothetical protein
VIFDVFYLLALGSLLLGVVLGVIGVIIHIARSVLK